MESVWSVSKLSTESVGSRRELVANCVHTADADATKQFRRVGGVYWALFRPIDGEQFRDQSNTLLLQMHNAGDCELNCDVIAVTSSPTGLLASRWRHQNMRTERRTTSRAQSTTTTRHDENVLTCIRTCRLNSSAAAWDIFTTRFGNLSEVIWARNLTSDNIQVSK